MTRITIGEVLMGVMAMGIFAFAQPTTASAQSVNDLVEMCAGCHGEKGVPIDKTIPNIWGQNRTYILNQLHDFHSGRRKNEQMSPIAESLSRSDIAALATYFSKKPWPKLDEPAPSADVQKTARSVLDTINCRACHQDQYQGDTTRPRLAGQQKDYLVKTMHDFREKHRTNYMGMVALMNAVDEANLEPVAAYLSSLKVDKDSK
jgi:cytochrome c553